MITLGDVLIKREQVPDCEIVVHPECRPEVIAAADFVYGTGGMLRHAAKTSARHIAIGNRSGHAPSTQEAGINEGVLRARRNGVPKHEAYAP